MSPLFAKFVSEIVMTEIPKVKTWKETQELMNVNYELMMQYGSYDPEKGFVEFK